MKIKVIVLCSYFEPEIAASMYISSNLYEDMANRGFEVFVYTPVPSRGVDSDTRRKYKSIKYECRCGGNLIIRRFSMFKEGRNSIMRACRYFMLSLVQFWKGIFTETDVIFVKSTPPMQGALGALLKLIKKVPLVYNIQDIFPESLVSTGLTRKNSFLWRIGSVIEKFTYQNADRIIVISEDFKQNLLSKGVYEEKIFVVPNWSDGNAVFPIERKDNKVFYKYNLDPNKFYISHCGNIGLTQNIDMLIQVAQDLRAFEDIAFILIGDGVSKENLEKKVAEMALTNIHMIPYQPYEDISHVFSIGDIGLVISKSGVGQSSVPSKAWSILSAERPILASFDLHSELAYVISRQKCGVCVPSEDRLALKNAILNLYTNRTNLTVMAKNGRKYVMENLTRAKGTAAYIEVIKNAVSR
jgi:glycosyltransferase involved in cell wall biosynthesis